MNGGRTPWLGALLTYIVIGLKKIMVIVGFNWLNIAMFDSRPSGLICTEPSPLIPSSLAAA